MTRSFFRAVVFGAASLALFACPPPDTGPTCDPGTQGCECVADKCGKNASGEQLVCQGGLCEQVSCTSGERGCACRNGATCNTPGDACTNGFCLAADCTAGAKDCSCIAGSCDVGLTCLSGTVCVDSTGYEGGACLDTGRCYRGSRCDSATSSCVHCEAGSAGCQCRDSGGCNGGLVCAADLCLPAAQLPPANPRCFTPCRADLTRDGETVTCGADGLLPGCLEGQSCVSGSCVSPTQTPPTCAGDLECPFFQLCLQGGCYSNCDVNADCASGLGCYRHACRASCRVSSGQASCPTGYACTSSDGENGFCLPVGTQTPLSAPQSLGGIVLPTTQIDVSNVKPQGDFAVVPGAPISQDVTVRKLWHAITWADGTSERVDTPLDSNGAYRECNAAANECPLWWLNLGATGQNPAVPPSMTQLLAMRVPAGCRDDTEGRDAGTQPCPHVVFTNAGGISAAHWEGVLELSSTSGRAQVHISYVERPEGQWSGAMYYFGNFSRDDAFDQWVASGDKTQTAAVSNALIKLWGDFRGQQNTIPGGWKQFQAILTATRTESWKQQVVRARCGAAPQECYPYSTGVERLTSNNRDFPIPSSVTELPVGFNLRLSATGGLEGRVESALAMHYPGNPAVAFSFESDPASGAGCFAGSGNGDCLVFLAHDGTDAGFNAFTSAVGGRYVSTTGDCQTDAGFVANATPWMVPGFTQYTTYDSTTQTYQRVECRDSQIPFAGAGAENVSLAGGNPLPNGVPVKRRLRFIDGALVNQNELFLLFEESFGSFIEGQPATTAYGYMVVKRAPAQLDDASYAARTQTVPARANRSSGATCSPEMLKLVSPTATSVDELDGGQLERLVDLLLKGSAVAAGAQPIASGVHYFCEDTGLFNAGPNPATGAVACPVGSRVIYFHAPTLTDAAIAAEACQREANAYDPARANCFKRLEGWVNGGSTLIQTYEPTWQCTGNQVYCDDNRFDLRVGKIFYSNPAAVDAGVAQLIALRPLVDSAFRYKTRFKATNGGSIGFAPVQCPANSDAVPYCYDPGQIEEARERIDCLVDIYARPGTVFGGSLLSLQHRDALVGFLRGSFSAYTQPSAEGFERLYAELLVMQGDEALTAAYASRFDLAAAGGASFLGSRFEAGGIDLTGVAGAEMYNLYLATQYYQLTLDRLYAFGPDFAYAFQNAPGVSTSGSNLISSGTVTDYLNRLVRAASQKSRAWGEIAKRYQNFNRPDLARAVIERAYMTTYLESALISRLMQQIGENADPSRKDQIFLDIATTQRTYRMALLDMRDIYGQITDDVNYFGYPPEYIPFPALDGVGSNAYDVLAQLARTRLDLAKTREQVALTSARQGRVDAAQFQSDLTSVRNTYENQLAQACGVFTGADGRVYPAIRKYADQDPRALLLGDPCGKMGNGDLHNAMAATKDAKLRLDGVLLREQNILADVEIERNRVASLCNVMQSQVDYQFSIAEAQSSLRQKADEIKANMAFTQGMVQAAMKGVEAAACETPLGCITGAIAGAASTAMGMATAAAQKKSDLEMAQREADLRNYDAASVRSINAFQCGGEVFDGGTVEKGILQIESEAKVAAMINDLLEVDVEAIRAEYSLRTAIADVARGFGNAERLQAQQEEAEQLAINLQQAQNDPNVRIYQNDSVINADVSFQDALATAYRLTRVYEYYTSQSYARKEQLFLIRMVSAGQYNLENYLLQLDNEFNAFEEEYGNPDLRVMALSLRDDIMKIPYLDTAGRPLSEDARIRLMRTRLADVKMLDSRGYLTIPFATEIAALSPLTRNHKVRNVEVDLQGVKLGDSTARVYLRMAGTGLVRSVNDTIDYYVFPERLAVINTSLLGSKVFDPEVYRNYRFRDRPLVNTHWELVLNLRDEQVNKDIELASLTDIRLLVYYTDFTSL